MGRHCGQPPPAHLAQRVARQKAGIERQLREVDSETLVLKLRHIVLYSNEEERLSVEQIQAQHLEINRCFMAENDTFATLPSEEPYNFAAVAASTNIAFAPIDSTELVEGDQLVYVKAAQSEYPWVIALAQVYAELNDQLDFSTVPSQYINLVYCNLGEVSGNSVLGIASQDDSGSGLPYNFCLVQHYTAGSPTLPGPNKIPGTVEDNYWAYGRTAVHELGHVLDLHHTFEPQGSCADDTWRSSDWSDNALAIDDLPSQKYPNNFVQRNGNSILYENTDVYCRQLSDTLTSSDNALLDAWGRSGVTGDLDCDPSRCATRTGFAAYANFMDYSQDNLMGFFSVKQGLVMRDHIESSSYFERTKGGVGIIPTAPQPDSGATFLGMPIAAVIVLAVVLVLVLILATGLYYKYNWKVKKRNAAAKG